MNNIYDRQVNVYYQENTYIATDNIDGATEIVEADENREWVFIKVSYLSPSARITLLPEPDTTSTEIGFLSGSSDSIKLSTKTSIYAKTNDASTMPKHYDFSIATCIKK